MVSNSSEQQNIKAVEAKVGGLVWVRRRNGSWWPGQILGLHQVLVDCIASPKSGTPIKLLGRDDATVDWYNLEKATRVKTFRCGEYDECIEEAKVSMAGYSRKAVKYARRAHAILRALELKSAIIPQDHGNCSASDNADSKLCSRRGEVSPATYGDSKDSECLSEQTYSVEVNSSSALEVSNSGISFEETNGTIYIKQLPIKATMERVPNKSEDEGSNGIRRMCGLDDLRHIESSRKMEPIGLIDVSQGNGFVYDSDCMPMGSMLNGTRDTMPTSKRKRSQLQNAHESSKKKPLCHTIAKVSDTLVTVPIIFDEFGDALGLGLKSKQSKRTSALATTDVAAHNGYVDADVEDLFDVPIDIEELHAGSSSSSLKYHNRAIGRADQDCKSDLEILPLGGGPVNELGSTSRPVTQINHVIAHNVDKTTSKWPIKGKRNLRHSTQPKSLNIGPNDLIPLPAGDKLRDISPNEYGSKGILPTIPHCSPQNGFELPQTSSVPEATVLYDVHIEVEANRRPQHVPYISLMSKLNRKAITGYPVAVEPMDDAYCDSLLDSSDYNPTSSGCELGDDEDAGMDYIFKPKLQSQPTPGKSKSSKSKKHSSSSKKTRRLSTLGTPHRSVRDKERSLVEDVKGPLLACIPLMLVFSRINEALNGSVSVESDYVYSIVSYPGCTIRRGSRWPGFARLRSSKQAYNQKALAGGFLSQESTIHRNICGCPRKPTKPTNGHDIYSIFPVKTASQSQNAVTPVLLATK
ncbi:hypothetical protein AKJ16_DCAP13089, partial [Drosera capensis]